jgi:lipoprotein-anchoring transpeptidase ErfK/SrfK
MRTPWGLLAAAALLTACASGADVIVVPVDAGDPAATPVGPPAAPQAAQATQAAAPGLPPPAPAPAPSVPAPPAPAAAPAPPAPAPAAAVPAVPAVAVPAPPPAPVPVPAPAAPAPAPPPPPGPTVPVPIFSGVGRRVVYDMGSMHVWLVEADGTVARDYPVSGHKARRQPGVGEFWVFSKSRYTGVANSPTRMEFMVRFARGSTGAAIGFHSIPTKHGRPIQSVEQLGQSKSAGCVRQEYSNAQFLFDWAPEGTKVFVVDTKGDIPPARPYAYPTGIRPITPWERWMTTPLLLTSSTVQ